MSLTTTLIDNGDGSREHTQVEWTLFLLIALSYFPLRRSRYSKANDSQKAQNWSTYAR